MAKIDALQKNINDLLQRQAGTSGLFKPKVAITFRMCSMESKPYQSIYVQQPSGLYRYLKSERIEVQARTEGPPTSQEQFVVESGHDERCAWCGCGGKRFAGSNHETELVFCDVCNWFVCVGKSHGSLFRCWCGAQGYLGGPVGMSGSVISQVGNPVGKCRQGGSPVNSVPPNRLQLGTARGRYERLRTPLPDRRTCRAVERWSRNSTEAFHE